MNPLPNNTGQQKKFLAALIFGLLCALILEIVIFSKAAKANQATPVTIDLTKLFNADRQINWFGGAVALKALSALPSGSNVLEGVPFQIGGVLQLCGVGVRADSTKFPNSIAEIPVGLKCSHLHFLHGTAWIMPKGTKIAAYVVHFADGTREEVPIIYGKDVNDWLFSVRDAIGTNGAAWSEETSDTVRENVRIYQSAWLNPKPKVEIKTIDFVAAGTKCAPFCLAITAEALPK